jgi:hypothetical protein
MGPEKISMCSPETVAVLKDMAGIAVLSTVRALQVVLGFCPEAPDLTSFSCCSAEE